jgi:glutamyl-Q tRNA(Asp) synthetase
MRIWSLHPKYLDAKGLVAVWREALLAQKVLQGLTKGYRSHPQLIRFRNLPDPVAAIAAYLRGIHDEAGRRGYSFDDGKIAPPGTSSPVRVTEGQMRFEWEHLKGKLKFRDPQRYRDLLKVPLPAPHPLFTVMEGGVEDWEVTSGDGRMGQVVGRFAPSPTGPLHVGSLVAAVGSYLMAKGEGGRWLLRMEDLDAPRVVPGMADDILRTLETLGFKWDGEVVRQSQRTGIYQAALDRLLAMGFAYPCGCSRAEIARIASAPHGRDGELVYPGTCREGLPPGKTPRAMRVRVPAEPISFHDRVMGEVRETLTESCGDFVVKRADGPFAYHLAVVVDDAEQGVNQVVRGADLLTSTPRQIHLQRLLDYEMPVYCHLPLVTGPGGAKLSKRDNAVSLSAGCDLAREGGALLLAALRFLGQSPPFPHNAPCNEILAWGVAHFDPLLIPALPAPATGMSSN